MKLDLLSTIRGSNLEDFFPAGWKLEKMEELASRSPDRLVEREPFWHDEFSPVLCD